MYFAIFVAIVYNQRSNLAEVTLAFYSSMISNLKHYTSFVTMSTTPFSFKSTRTALNSQTTVKLLVINLYLNNKLHFKFSLILFTNSSYFIFLHLETVFLNDCF